MNMPVAPKQKIAMTPIGTIAKESEEAQAKRRGGKGTMITPNSGLINDPETNSKTMLG